MSVNLKNSTFLQEHYHVLCHHINCILKSSMILDEDVQLVTTFWNPALISKKSSLNYSKCASITCAAVGLLFSMKSYNFYPLAICLAPAAFQMSYEMKTYYTERKYKQNFERLVGSIRDLYDVNRNIVEYCHKRVLATQDRSLPSLLGTKSGQEFLKRAIALLLTILEKLKETMLQVCELIPISEGEYIYSLEWRLEDLKNYEDNDFKDLKRHFEKLNNMYVLMVSNFLSCIGLSLCVQLWKEAYCDFRYIFSSLIPGLCRFFDSSLGELRVNFDTVRFTLPNLDREVVTKSKSKTQHESYSLQLQRPLTDFLANVQITFETARQLHSLLDDNLQGKYEDLFPVVEEITDQLTVCDDSLNGFIQLYSVLTKRSLTRKVDSLQQGWFPESSNSVVKAEIHFDDPEERLEDEEYNLSIHGSEEEDSMDAICDYADQCSTEHLEIMLFELKRKLNERRGKKGKVELEEVPNKTEQDTLLATKLPIEQSLPPLPPPIPSHKGGSGQNSAPPVPPPPVMMHQLPAFDSSHLGFLDAVKNVAQQLNRDEEFQFGFNMFPEIPRPFNTTYRCFSVAMLPGNERQDVERGGKIIMPPSALEQLTRLNINYPMLFKIVNKNTSRTTHCGVLEFVADEGKVYLPLWMMHNLVLEEGDLIQLESVSLPVGTFAKFQPLSPEFLDITNPKAVLENCLRTFACLTSGDVIAVKYNQRVYELCVLETQPGNAISIIECDMNVEFAAPVGYKEHEVVKQPEEDMVVDPADLMPEPAGFVAFRGAGNRLDGKRRKDSGPSEASSSKPVYIRGIPDYDYEIGTLRFLRHFTKSLVSNKEEEENGEFKAFSGEGFSLKRRN